MTAYARQANSARTRALLAEDIVAVSRLAEVEIVSALARLARDGSISEARRDAGISTFVRDLGGWEIVEVSPEVTAGARGLLLRHRLRAGDAIQLASALLLQARLAEPLQAFVAFDARLLEAARSEGLAVGEG